MTGSPAAGPGAPGAPLVAALRAYHRDALRRMAAAAGLSDTGPKEGLVDALARHLSSPAAIDAALARQSDLERGLLDTIAGLGGYATTAGLVEHVAGGVAGRPGPARQAIHAALGRLAARGLVLSEPAAGRPPVRESGPGEHLFVPAPVLERLGGEPVDVPASFAEPPPSAVILPAPEGTLVRDCYFYWSAVRDNPTAVTSRGLVAKRDLLRLNAALSVQESLEGVPGEDRAGRLYFLRGVLEAVGLVEHEGALLRARETGLFHRPAGERALLLFAAWRDGTWWNEMARLADLRLSVPRSYQPYVLHQVLMARAFVLRLLRGLPAGRWYTFAALDERVRLAKADFLIGRESAPFWGGHGGGAGIEYAYGLQWAVPHGSTWDSIEGRFVRAVVTEPLLWMGCCDVALDEGQPLAFRLTPGGHGLLVGDAAAAGGAEAQEGGAGESGRVIVQPNFDILVYAPVSPHLLADLDRFATRQTSGNVLHYHLSRTSLYRAQLQGSDAAAVVALLEEMSGRALPQNVRYSLLDWQRQHERITIHEGMALCQVADPALLAELAAPPAGQTLGLLPLAPDVALAPPAVLDALRGLLEGRGYLPRVLGSPTDDEGADSLALGPEGEITVRAPLLTLAVRGELERFADAREDGRGYVLTPAGLRRGVAGGLTVAAIAAWLEGHTGAPVPADLLDRMKIWSGHYGTVRLSRAIVVQVGSPEILADLRADAQVGSLLTPLAPAAGLAAVADDGLAALRALLAAKGIAVDDSA